MTQPFTPGRDPRDYVRNHRERGPKRYEYTYQGLADRLDVSLSTVQNARPQTPEALARLVHRQQVRKGSRRLTESEVEAVVGEGKLGAWENRWPRVTLWWCGACGQEVLLSQGLCRGCGGGVPAMALDSKLYLTVRVGSKYVPYHRLVLPTDLIVHHEDGNKWNNRPSNLVAMDSAGHWEEHQFGGGE